MQVIPETSLLSRITDFQSSRDRCWLHSLFKSYESRSELRLGRKWDKASMKYRKLYLENGAKDRWIHSRCPGSLRREINRTKSNIRWPTSTTVHSSIFQSASIRRPWMRVFILANVCEESVCYWFFCHSLFTKGERFTMCLSCCRLEYIFYYLQISPQTIPSN